ncbi:MAG: thiolase family protein [Planctomycetota bacterium]|nr:thiolase family protein [Planctomycetota bacterium]MED5507415.1 thiolase family protein [Planctomycetota bacterium]
MPRTAIIDAVRTPIGRFGGTLATVRPDDLAARVLEALVDRTGLDPALVDDVYFGAANQSGEDNRNVARMAALLAGFPETVPGATVNRLCASGLEAVNIAARMIEAGHGEVFLAGGVESMSRAPYVLGKSETPYGRSQELHDTAIGWRFVHPRMTELGHTDPLGVTAENVARRYGVTRMQQDEFALRSQRRWAEAREAGRFSDEIVPVEVPRRKGEPILFDTDEHPRPETSLEALAGLRPAFSRDEDATVTAGNSSGVNDGAACLLLMEAGRARELGYEPIAYVGASASAGVEPAFMGMGPVPAIRAVLDRAGLSLDRIDLVELNEAFAAQSVACCRELGLDPERVNVNGGAIALGHPLGCSGARLATTLVHEMKRRGASLGIASLCVGVGQGLATVFERD